MKSTTGHTSIRLHNSTPGEFVVVSGSHHLESSSLTSSTDFTSLQDKVDDLENDLAANSADIQTLVQTKAPINNPTFTGSVSGISKSDVGLANVDNTSDANKPVSTAQQTALNTKQDDITNSTNLDMNILTLGSNPIAPSTTITNKLI